MKAYKTTAKVYDAIQKIQDTLVPRIRENAPTSKVGQDELDALVMALNTLNRLTYFYMTRSASNKDLGNE